ncbi:thiolase family protein [Sulfobacillus thermosulfidooxidans]|uniref:thiolase family protein n=1 Tax=Sulfobacillus thermosulfidooxidans TaxID=28034 RepID=UPI0002E5D9FD|nr:thiolase family protein [Sulfobacillus thermosulfidooxidans]
MSQAFIVDALRTPIGNVGGALATVRPDDLAALVIATLVKRNHLEGIPIDDVFMGCANQAGEDNRNVARMATLLADLPPETPAVTVNRLCGSGLEAVIEGCRAVIAEEADIVIVGGVESMSRAPWVLPKPDDKGIRKDQTLYDTTLGWRMVNPKMIARGYDPITLGETAENVAQKFGISRLEQDEWALRSHQRAQDAWHQGFFYDEVIPVDIQDENFFYDEHIRLDTSLEKLSRLRPAFRQPGTVTAGNSSGINDGAAAILVASENAVKRYQWKPLAKYVASAAFGVHPNYMGIGPIPATRKLLSRTPYSLQDVGTIELNEAFAAQVLAVIKELELNPNLVNPQGGAIALGHPLGCSGARIVTTLVHRMRREDIGLGLATLCIGVGQGLSMLVELQHA